MVVHTDFVVEDDDTPLDYIPGCSMDWVVGRKKVVGTVVGMRTDLMELVELELELVLIPVVL